MNGVHERSRHVVRGRYRQRCVVSPRRLESDRYVPPKNAKCRVTFGMPGMWASQQEVEVHSEQVDVLPRDGGAGSDLGLELERDKLEQRIEAQMRLDLEARA